MLIYAVPFLTLNGKIYFVRYDITTKKAIAEFYSMEAYKYSKKSVELGKTVRVPSEDLLEVEIEPYTVLKQHNSQFVFKFADDTIVPGTFEVVNGFKLATIRSVYTAVIIDDKLYMPTDDCRALFRELSGDGLERALSSVPNISGITSSKSTEFDPVQKPSHYNQGGIECIEAIKASMTNTDFRAYLKGNVEKYLWRYEKKQNPKQDLEKAKWYLERLIKELD
jgi:hypothetical protein